MNAPKFTPGEWRVHTGTAAGAVAVYCAAGNICTLRHRQQSRYAKKRDRDQTIRDAALIAAAPELYEELALAVEALEKVAACVSPELAIVISDRAMFARAALAKAAP